MTLNFLVVIQDKPYKKNYQECEKELIELRESIKAEVKKGKIEDNQFLILDRRIKEHLNEMKAEEKEKVVNETPSPYTSQTPDPYDPSPPEPPQQ